MMASTAENEAIVYSTSPQILTTSAAEDQVCDAEMLPVPEDYMTTTTSHDADIVLDQEFVVPFPDPASTLDIHGPARSDQGVQGTCSLPSSSEQMAFRAASHINHSEAVHENGVQPPNISHGTPLPMGQNPPRHLFSDPYEYELEKIRIEEENLKKSVEEATSQLMAELDRKMAEARSEFDKETQEFDAKVMEVDARMGLVRTGSLLGNAFVSKCSERSASNDLAAVRAAMISQHSTQQQQAVQTNTQMSSTAPPRVRPQQESTRLSTSAPPRPSVVSVDNDPVPNSSAPLPHLPRRTTTTQTSPVTQQTVQAHSHVNSTAPTPPSVTSVEPQTPNSSGPLHHLPRPTTQPSPMSQQTVQAADTHVNSTAPTPPPVTAVEPQTPNHLRPLARFPQPSLASQQAVSQSNTNANSSTPLPRPSAITEGLPLHSPLSNTPRPRPRPVISNVTPPSSSSPPVRGPAPHLVRASAPHLARRPAPHLRQYGSFPAPTSAAAAPTTHPRRSVQEQEQQQLQQGKSNGGLVNLSDED
ncbi:PREDICTED: flocculation protein FLO11 isoform X1 [Brassica oleracea var. oleracea]|uniref:flocculation protein FLO11 isoform X1 n=1 Tax=Brassica oleracea var. oleracea TaxID=109376 RepID=UPI0006A6FCD7|nr:PREDICTED: flocculation protein FLO11 isoform X1 [Brassica oleracea var. oleracea]XP_013631512.1 PREDICTED: flocculation protein FLO11 isoform X1 [Brassica oleracea var. oleracea]XP_013631513.1 PREDICTED: flocculation protein FLO11 isoform X1 [Brassica oleracea var. oleracea]